MPFQFEVVTGLHHQILEFPLLPDGFCSSYNITIVVLLKFPGHRVLFIIQDHNRSSSIKISWPHGFVHLPIIYSNSNMKISWPHGFSSSYNTTKKVVLNFRGLALGPGFLS